MTELLDTTPHHVSSSYIPERQFWIPEEAEKYLDDDGNPRRTIGGAEDYERREIPLIDPINYPLVDMHAFIDDMLTLVDPSYKFPRYYVKKKSNGDEIIHKMDDNIDHLQPQHQYYSIGNNKDSAGWAFCNNPDRKAKVTVLIHNIRNNFYADPQVPGSELQIAHLNAMRLCKNALMSAVDVIRSNTGVVIRREAVKSGKQKPKDDHEDRAGEQWVRERSKQHVESYKKHREKLVDIPEVTPYYPLAEKLSSAKPIDTIRELSRVVPLGEYWEMGAYIRHRDPSAISRDPRKNRYITKALKVT